MVDRANLQSDRALVVFYVLQLEFEKLKFLLLARSNPVECECFSLVLVFGLVQL